MHPNRTSTEGSVPADGLDSDEPHSEGNSTERPEPLPDTNSDVSVDTGDFTRELWSTHGIVAAVAWGIVAPAAIASSMLRGFFPFSSKAWLKFHISLHVVVLVLTMVSLGVAVYAHSQSTPRNGKTHHFGTSTHASVGLGICIAIVLQVLGGAFRPPAPVRRYDGSMGRKKILRVLWEYVHRGVGITLVAVCWWQVHTGLALYEKRFSTKNLFLIFWLVVGGLSGFIGSLYAYHKLSTLKPYYRFSEDSSPSPSLILTTAEHI